MPVTDWKPALTDVGAVLRMRTRDATGLELGTFTSATSPTAAEAQPVVDGAAEDVASLIGADISAGFRPAAKYVAALNAALTIELSFFGDQVAAGHSPYDKLKQLFDERLARLKADVDSSGQEAPGDADMRPQGGYGPTGQPCQPWPYMIDWWEGYVALPPDITYPVWQPW